MYVQLVQAAERAVGSLRPFPEANRPVLGVTAPPRLLRQAAVASA